MYKLQSAGTSGGWQKSPGTQACATDVAKVSGDTMQTTSQKTFLERPTQDAKAARAERNWSMRPSSN
jgi:hypothetical protein